jgi:PAS domain S-box-containing protein
VTDRSPKEALEQLRHLADNLPGGMVYQIEANGSGRRFLYVSRGVKDLFGVSPEEALADASSVYERIDPQQADRLAQHEAEALASGAPFMAEVRVFDGQRHRWVQISSAQRRREDGIAVWDGVALDVTTRKEAELAAMEAERRLELATAAADAGIWHWDLAAGELDYSERAKAIYGFPADQRISYELLLARTFPEDLGIAGPKLKRAFDPNLRSRETYRYRITRADTGEVRWLDAVGHATFGRVEGEEKAVAYTGILRDVTDEVSAQQALADGAARLWPRGGWQSGSWMLLRKAWRLLLNSIGSTASHRMRHHRWRSSGSDTRPGNGSALN